MPPILFVDRMATIDETVDVPTSPEQSTPSYKLVNMNPARTPGFLSFISAFIGVQSLVLTSLFFPILRFMQLTEIGTYLWYLITTSVVSGTGTSPKLFALSQVLDLLPTITDLIVANIAFFHTRKSDEAEELGVFKAEGDGLPGVDLVITTCKEAVDIILDTVKACLDLDYPAGKLRVIVSDDGRDTDLKAALGPPGRVFPNLMYFTRPVDPSKHHGYKAGNINATLKMLETEELEPNPWVCNLDCDMIPDREMLRVLMAPALRDDKVGLVTLPQDFYNIPINDPLHENLQLQHRRDQMVRDEFHAAWCPGSGFIFSRKAWKQVGGFYEMSMCDDLYFGWSLNGAGYRTAYVDACLQSGLQPESFQDHLKQRRRWFVGGMRNCKYLRLGFGAPVLKGMTRMQRLIALNQIPKPYLSTLVKGIVAVLNIACLALGIVYSEAIVNVGSDHFTRILYAFMYHKCANLVFDGFSSLKYGHNVRRRAVVNIWQGMHLVKSAIDEELPYWLGGYRLGFQATGVKSGTTLVLSERDASVRPSTGIRLSIAHQTERVLFHLVYFIIVMGLTLWNVHCIVSAARSWDTMFFWLISGPLFPGLNIENAFAHLSPVFYLVIPPTMKDRRDLMYLDERTGGYRPKYKNRGVRFTKAMWFWELLNIASVAWAVFAFCKMNDTNEVGRVGENIPVPSNQRMLSNARAAIPFIMYMTTLLLVYRYMAKKAAADRKARAAQEGKDI